MREKERQPTGRHPHRAPSCEIILKGVGAKVESCLDLIGERLERHLREIRGNFAQWRHLERDLFPSSNFNWNQGSGDPIHLRHCSRLFANSIVVVAAVVEMGPDSIVGLTSSSKLIHLNPN